MKEISIRQSKIYNVLGIFLKRKNLNNSHSVARILIDKFALCEQTDSWKFINHNELKELNIIPCENHKTFRHWRTSMIEKEILICEANEKELSSDKANYKCNMFKPGKAIEKYIDKAKLELLPGKVETLFKSVEVLDNKLKGVDHKLNGVDHKLNAVDSRFKGVDNRVETLEDKFEDLHNEMKGMASIILTLCPPDTEERRKIIQSNYTDIQKCLLLLKEKEGEH